MTIGLNLKMEKKIIENIRFRTLAATPTAAVNESNAKNMSQIITELKESTFAERSGRLARLKMKKEVVELKKKDGYYLNE